MWRHAVDAGGVTPTHRGLLVMTGLQDRHQEARTAAAHFLTGADVTFHLNDLPDGRFRGDRKR